MSNLVGSFLIARPSLRDGFFSRSVVLMLQHSEEGAFGLVLNRPAQAKELPFPVFVGGPCKMDGLLMIHGRKEWLGENAEDKTEVCPGVFLGTTDQFAKATETDDAEAGRFRVFTGYSGWGPQQLEGEIQEGAWIVLPANGKIIFETAPQDLWEKLAPRPLPEPSLN